MKHVSNKRKMIRW